MSLSNGQLSKTKKIGLFGFGVVGEALYRVLKKSTGIQAEIKTICIKNPGKERRAPAHLFTTDADAILNDSAIDFIVELTDDAEAAFRITSAALQRGKPVVSANKLMVASNLQALIKMQQKFNTPVLYEASCGASIPIIRNLEEYYDNDMLRNMRGIVNGCTNYILSQMQEQQLSYKEALLLARQKGFAESNPALDVDGHDAANKLTILLAHAFGILQTRDQILFRGITTLNERDFEMAGQRGQKIKLVANIASVNERQLAAFVLPQFVTAADDLYNVNNEYNGIITESSFADTQFFKGRGAGGNPTAAAVLSDISALGYNYRYEYKKLHQTNNFSVSDDYYLRIYAGSRENKYLGDLDFEWIDEVHRNKDYSTVAGTIHRDKLFASKAYRSGEVSIIAGVDPVARDVSYKKYPAKA